MRNLIASIAFALAIAVPAGVLASGTDGYVYTKNQLQDEINRLDISGASDADYFSALDTMCKGVVTTSPVTSATFRYYTTWCATWPSYRNTDYYPYCTKFTCSYWASGYGGYWWIGASSRTNAFNHPNKVTTITSPVNNQYFDAAHSHFPQIPV